jgi:sulfur carrier protein ThiS
MTVYVKLHGGLNRKENKSDIIEVNLAKPSNLVQFAQALGIQHKEIGFLTINGVVCKRTDLLEHAIPFNERDIIEVFTAMKGG